MIMQMFNRVLLLAAFCACMCCEWSQAHIWDKERDTALLQACSEGTTEDIRLLLERGADANAVNADGQTALMLAAQHQIRGEAIKLLLAANADLEATDPRGQTAIMIGIRNPHASVMEAMLDGGARFERRGPQYHETPLMNAARDNPNHEVVKLLLDAGASMKSTNKFGMNALMHATTCTQNINLFKLGNLPL